MGDEWQTSPNLGMVGALAGAAIFVALVVGATAPSLAGGHPDTTDRSNGVETNDLQTKAACGYEQVTVSGAKQREFSTICKALDEVLAYFQRLDFRVEPKFSLYFRTGAETINGPRAHGYFNRKTSEISILRGPQYKPWGLDETPEISASFLRHEFVHMTLLRLLGSDYEKIRRPWHELIAYAVQIDLMQSGLRERILDRYSSTMAFDYQEAVNEFTYGADTNIFSIAAFKTYQANGGAKFVGKLIRFDIVPTAMPAMFQEMLQGRKRGTRN